MDAVCGFGKVLWWKTEQDKLKYLTLSDVQKTFDIPQSVSRKFVWCLTLKQGMAAASVLKYLHGEYKCSTDIFSSCFWFASHIIAITIVRWRYDRDWSCFTLYWIIVCVTSCNNFVILFFFLTTLFFYVNKLYHIDLVTVHLETGFYTCTKY